MKDRVIADFEHTERMLSYFIEQAHNRKFGVRPRIVIGEPDVIQAEFASHGAGQHSSHLVGRVRREQAGRNGQGEDGGGVVGRGWSNHRALQRVVGRPTRHAATMLGSLSTADRSISRPNR